MTRINQVKVLKVLLILLGVFVLYLLITPFADRILNGMFKEWFFQQFITIGRDNDGNDYERFVGWSEMKALLSRWLLYGLLVLTMLILMICNLYAAYKKRKEIAYISDGLYKLIHEQQQEDVFPAGYEAIENQILQLMMNMQQKEQQLQTESQRKNDLITYLAHDLKTPLASVVGYLSLLEEASDLPDKQRLKYTGIALDKAYRLENLINEFFDITRFNLQQIVVNYGQVNLTMLLTQLADEFYPVLADQGKEAVLECEESIRLQADADKLARVFNNILKNAAAYSYPDSKIVIKAWEREDKVIVQISNQGDPIPKHQLETIFEKFFRLDQARSTRTGGAGLGLAIAKEIVAAHGGDIWVSSTTEKTVFSVVLPAVQPPLHREARM